LSAHNSGERYASAVSSVPAEESDRKGEKNAFVGQNCNGITGYFPALGRTAIQPMGAKAT
jgi:hypothetical protein